MIVSIFNRSPVHYSTSGHVPSLWSERFEASFAAGHNRACGVCQAASNSAIRPYPRRQVPVSLDGAKHVANADPADPELAGARRGAQPLQRLHRLRTGRACPLRFHTSGLRAAGSPAYAGIDPHGVTAPRPVTWLPRPRGDQSARRFSRPRSRGIPPTPRPHRRQPVRSRTSPPAPRRGRRLLRGPERSMTAPGFAGGCPARPRRVLAPAHPRHEGPA